MSFRPQYVGQCRRNFFEKAHDATETVITSPPAVCRSISLPMPALITIWMEYNMFNSKNADASVFYYYRLPLWNIDGRYELELCDAEAAESKWPAATGRATIAAVAVRLARVTLPPCSGPYN